MKRYLFIPIFLVMVLILSGCIENTSSDSSPAASSSAVSSPAASNPVLTISTTVEQNNGLPVPSAVSDFEMLLESIYSQVSPSIVSIQVIKSSGTSTLIPGSPFSPPSTQVVGLGSGFVWNSSGDIVTNNHVVSEATSITVTFIDGTTVDASVVGTDSDSDLAVIKVSTAATQLQPVTLADSTQLKVGQLAVAIGNPFGLTNTMTVGHVSGLGRLLPASQNTTGPVYSIPDVIQTDAAINPGNSGGVLLDNSGKVIGVTSSIETTTGSSSGVGFAIPSAIVQQVVPSLISTGHYDHPYLGIAIISLDPDLAGAMNLPANQHGALVESVVSGGPAAAAGIKESTKTVTFNGQQVNVGGDVIVAYNGHEVKTSDDLITFLERSGKIGQKVTLTILRDGQQMDVEVTLGVRPVTTHTSSTTP